MYYEFDKFLKFYEDYLGGQNTPNTMKVGFGNCVPTIK